jgi:tetratricopeptide (TPR) repeat protein
LPEAKHMLASLRIRCEGDELVVEHAQGDYEAESGQMVLDFDTEHLHREAAEVHALPWVADGAERPEPTTAYGWFLRGCELESQWDGSPVDQAGFESARAAYEEALHLDPELAAAWTNLGSMFAEMGADDEARTHFGQAVRCDPLQAEAHMNLAELSLREGDADGAIVGYRKVLSMAPDSFEAHYGLARSLLEVGGKVQAAAHLRRFCEEGGGAANDDGDSELQARIEAARTVLTRLEAELRES